MKKKFLAAIAAGLIAFGSFNLVDAATRDEIATIQVKKAKDFKFWTKNSVANQKLIEFVTDVTNKKSKNYIPPEDRIATFDMDGTFLCETAPYYFDGMLLIERALYDENYTASESTREFTIGLEKFIRDKTQGDKLGSSAPHQAAVFEGMTNEEHAAYVRNFMKKPVEGLTNLKYGESFYLPMVEVIKYLQANDFKVYVVSGSERNLIRVLVCDVLKLPTNQIIGTDIKFLAAHQDKDGLDYTYRADDYLIRGEFVIKNLKMNKVSRIAEEIGKQPVLAFGNSSGDAAMLNYTINRNKYRSMAFFLICDDVERELGNLNRARKDKKLAEDNGWIPISMQNDFKTIYGDNVKLDK